MTSIKLVAVDIDGTLLNSKREITPEVAKAVQENQKALKLLLLQDVQSSESKIF